MEVAASAAMDRSPEQVLRAQAKMRQGFGPGGSDQEVKIGVP